MFPRFLLLGLFTSLTVCIAATTTDVVAQVQLAQPWQGAYSGANSSGPQVMGHWRFEAGEVTKDSGPRGQTGKLDGVVAVEAGRFGGGIESFPGWPLEDKHHALVVANHPSLTPRGAFIAETNRMLDTALANDFGIAATLYAGYSLKQRPELARVDRDGKPYARHDCNAALPGLAEFSENVGASVAQTYGKHPALVAALVNSEVRDDSEVSFAAFDREQYRKFGGRDIPPEVITKSGVQWQTIKDFPADRVIPDDHPLLRFYRWFWTVGDGWNGLHTALHRGLKSTGRDDIWTWYDPAIRVPSIAGRRFPGPCNSARAKEASSW